MAVGKKGAAERITRTERRTQALHLRRAGASYRDIASTLKTSEPTVRRDVAAALAELAAEQRAGAAELRALEAARLDALQLAYWKPALAGDGEAAKIVLRVLERRAKLLGLDLQPGATVDTNIAIILRWADANRHIIDVTPPAGNHLAAPAPDAGADSSPPRALPYRVRWETLGQEPAGGDAEPQDGA